jgi:WD40 repeat protein
MRPIENEIRSTHRDILATPVTSKRPARAPRIFIRFRMLSPKWLFALALISSLALSPDVVFAQSRKANTSRSFDSDVCERESVPLTVHEGLALIRVSINGKSLTFIVDSAGMTIINSDHVSLPLVQRIRTGTVTVSAAETLDLWNVVQVDSLTVGTGELRDSKILSRSLRALETQLGQELDGIFGHDALRLWDSFSLDYRHKVLVLQRSRCSQPPSTESLWRLERDALRVGK